MSNDPRQNISRRNDSLKKLAQGGLMVALATILSLFTPFKAPYGGSVTIGSMVPIILYAILYRHEVKRGVFVGLVYSLLQLLLGLNSIAGISLGAWFGSVLLDYLLAFSVLGIAGMIARGIHNRVVGAGVAALVVSVLRFVCHFLSGILIWGDYAPEGQPVWLYSLTYNGGFMLFETLITVVLVCLLMAVLPLKRMGFED